MGLFGRRRTPDGDAAAALARAHGERSMASARTDDGVLLVATDRALHIGDERLPWDRVAKASWDADEAMLTVVGSPAAGRAPVSRTLPVHELPQATRLLEVVRTMVTSNLVVSERITSTEFGGAWVTCRHDPDEDGLRWTVVFDPGLDPADPARRAWADEQVAAIRRATGV